MGVSPAKPRVIDHPLVTEILTVLRDKNTPPRRFRECLIRLGEYMAYELAKLLDVEEKEVITPLGRPAKGIRIKDRDKLVIVSVLRAAIPFSEGVLKVFPEAKQGLVSARRVEETHKPGSTDFEVEVNYVSVPKLKGDEVLVVTDPMLATGSTLLKVIKEIIKAGRPRRIIILTAISTPVAVERLLKEFKDLDLEIITASLDPVLDDRGYIVPGLGDAGDRAFGTV